MDTHVIHIPTIARVRIFCDMWRRIFQCGLPALLTNVYRINPDPDHTLGRNPPTKNIQKNIKPTLFNCHRSGGGKWGDHILEDPPTSTPPRRLPYLPKRYILQISNFGSDSNKFSPGRVPFISGDIVSFLFLKKKKPD